MFILVIIILICLFAVIRCSISTEKYPFNPDQEVSAEIADVEQFDPRDYADDGLPPTDCSLFSKLYIADGPGKPVVNETDSQLSINSIVIFPNKSQVTVVSSSVVQLNIPTLPSSPIIVPKEPIPLPFPTPVVKVINPVEGSQLSAESNFQLQWTIDSRRQLTVDVLFSADGGETYQAIVTGIANTNAHELTVPDVVSDNCIFRVNAWVGTTLLGYNVSPTFGVTDAPTPIPTPSPEPAPDEVNMPPSYTQEKDAFISADGDASRWFSVEHDLANVDRMIWQISRIPFPCDINTLVFEPSGLLARGQLTSDTTEFKIDFTSIMASFEAKTDDHFSDELPENQGEPFDAVSGLILSKQLQRELYMRVILLDDADQVIGITRSGFQIVYGKHTLDLVAAKEIDLLPQRQPPVLTAKSEPGFAPGTFEAIADKGLYIYAGGISDWSFMLEDIPTDSVEVDFQISTLPFKTATPSDYQQPGGLVYQSEATGLSYTTVTKYYHVPFSDFAPESSQLGEDTIQYYMRAVCYVPGPAAGTVVPVATKTHSVFYTGDLKAYQISQLDVPPMKVRDVVVKSYVPHTDFQRYIPVQWPIKDYQEYFEVTRPIEAEEICFSIKNSKTGDFLYPYATHMMLFPNTTRAEYQEIVDRMLPPGAWFKLTMNQSGWDALWSEFFDLLGQVYSSIQNAYNGLKATVANTIAAEFTFLGADAQAFIRTAVHGLIDYGLASVGLPPSLPNFQHLADQGMDYCVRVALDEAAQSMGVPTDQIPDEVRQEIVGEIKQQLNTLVDMNGVNPLDVDYLKPATKAMYRPAYVDVKVFNQHDGSSAAGTLTISYYPVGKPHFKMYKYVCLPIPSLETHQSTTIRVYLQPDNTDLPIYKDYYWGDIGECLFQLTATYDVPDIEDASAQQGVDSYSASHYNAYVYDYDPIYQISLTSTPCNSCYD